MVHAFLASAGLSGLGPWLDSLPDRVSRIALVDAAAQPMPEAPFVAECAKAVEATGRVVVPLDLVGASQESVQAILADVEAVFVTGGYVRFLLQQAVASGFDEVVRTRSPRGLAYVGVSAGAVLAGPDVSPNVGADDPGVIRSTAGLGLVDFVVLPHANRRPVEHYEVLESRFADRWRLVRLRDDEAIVVDGDVRRLVASS